MTIKDATEHWVHEMNAVPTNMIDKLMRLDIADEWTEVTKPSAGDTVYVFDLPDELDTLEHGGEIISYNAESDLYRVELYSGELVSCNEFDFDVEREEMLPMWGTMWSFGDSADDWWLEEGDGIKAMSECGFRVYSSEEFGYFFGIDGAGYDFYESHWIPLYKARGLQWHDPVAEQEYRMNRKGYKKRMFCGKPWWCDGDELIEEVKENV